MFFFHCVAVLSERCFSGEKIDSLLEQKIVYEIIYWEKHLNVLTSKTRTLLEFFFWPKCHLYVSVASDPSVILSFISRNIHFLLFWQESFNSFWILIKKKNEWTKYMYISNIFQEKLNVTNWKTVTITKSVKWTNKISQQLYNVE